MVRVSGECLSPQLRKDFLHPAERSFLPPEHREHRCARQHGSQGQTSDTFHNLSSSVVRQSEHGGSRVKELQRHHYEYVFLYLENDARLLRNRCRIT